MERKKFIKTCGVLGVGAPLASFFLDSCTSYYYANFTEDNQQLMIPLSEFEKEETEKARKFILLDTSFSKYPICVFKTGEKQYTAALMRCTHKGCQVNVEGDMYSCPCHGSAFSKAGEVLEGPATHALKTFKTKIVKENIYVEIN